MGSVARLLVVSTKKYKWQVVLVACCLLFFSHTLLSPTTFSQFQILENYSATEQLQALLSRQNGSETLGRTQHSGQARVIPRLKVPSDHPMHAQETNRESEAPSLLSELTNIEGEVVLTGQGNSVEVADESRSNETLVQQQDNSQQKDDQSGAQLQVSRLKDKIDDQTEVEQPRKLRTGKTGTQLQGRPAGKKQGSKREPDYTRDHKEGSSDTDETSVKPDAEQNQLLSHETANTTAATPTHNKKHTESSSSSFLSGLIKVEDGVLNIKPLVNRTLNYLGLLQEDDSDLSKQSGDSIDNKLVLKSMFYMWNPKASAWALNMSHAFRNHVLEHGEEGNKFTKYNETRQRSFQLEHCNCSRTLTANHPWPGSLNDSTCSRDSFLRGPGQRVVGFSFYGNPNSTQSKSRKYFQGIEENLGLLSQFYPGWTMRVYFDLEAGDPLRQDLCRLACSNQALDLCHVRRLPSSLDISHVFAMIWRFFPVVDPQVDVYVSRDLDSRLNEREVAAVADWLASQHHFHFMRDHPAHGIEILGSGWGVSLGPVNSTVRSFMSESFHGGSRDPLFWAPRNSYGPDQGFLKRYLWPWGKWSAMSHDAYTCQRFPRTRPFPTRRKEELNNFVASVVEAKDIMKKECPVACRPKNHQDWLTC